MIWNSGIRRNGVEVCFLTDLWCGGVSFHLNAFCIVLCEQFPSVFAPQLTNIFHILFHMCDKIQLVGRILHIELRVM